MVKQHIAVFTPMIGGHVVPALSLCSELVGRGHRVTYPCNESYAARIRETGATPVEFQHPEFLHTGKVGQDSASEAAMWRTFTALIAPLSLTTAAVAVAEVEAFYAKHRPDVILYDWFAFAGRILAKRLGCPAVQIHAHFAHRESLMRLDGVCTTPEPLDAFATLLDSFMATYGFEGRRHLWHYEKLNIIFMPRQFQYDIESFDDRFRFVGATHRRKPRVGAWKSAAPEGAPVVLISEATSSTDGAFLRLCIEALGDSRYHVVVSKAPNSPEVPRAALPGNFQINRDAYNCEILPFAAVMVCESGLGTTLEALHHGVPLVALPPNMFNSEVAYRVAELGLGTHIRQHDIAPPTLREAVDIVYSDEPMRQRVKRLQSELASTPGARGAVDAIEEYLAAL